MLVIIVVLREAKRRPTISKLPKVTVGASAPPDQFVGSAAKVVLDAWRDSKPFRPSLAFLSSRVSSAVVVGSLPELTLLVGCSLAWLTALKQDDRAAQEMRSHGRYFKFIELRRAENEKNNTAKYKEQPP